MKTIAILLLAASALAAASSWIYSLWRTHQTHQAYLREIQRIREELEAEGEGPIKNYGMAYAHVQAYVAVMLPGLKKQIRDQNISLTLAALAAVMAGVAGLLSL